MNLKQGAAAQHLVDDLLDKIHQYDDTLYMSTVIGVLELVKQQLINDLVVITVNGGNDEASDLCRELINEMEKEK
jgi:hypothetical protein